jgi:predicted regulator of Ras-like GTPase activity (Roadblock/LC7/MglB family)
VARKTTTAGDLRWLLDDLVGRVEDTEHAAVLSADGLLIAASAGLTRDDGEHLAAVAAGFQSLARGVGERFGGGAVRQTIIELESRYLLVTSAGQGACIAVLATGRADIGLVAYEMAMLVTPIGLCLGPDQKRDAGDG